MNERATGARNPGLVAYVEEVASSAPTPGGGSAAAVVGGLAAALGEMVVNLTPARTDDPTGAAELRASLDRLGTARRRLLALAVDDERVYQGYRTAAALPRSTTAERASRSAAMQTALLASAKVPLDVATALADLFPDLERVARLGNKHLLSDAEVAAILAEAAVRAATVNVRVNARLLLDTEPAAALLARAVAVEEDAAAGFGAVRDVLTDPTR
jgi:formiminotetrahydrofolate cyclodeaminase